MLHGCKKIARLALAIGLSIGLGFSTANAYEGKFTFPANSQATIAFEFRHEPNNINKDINSADVFQVFVGKRDECCEGKSPIAGRYSIAGQTVTFTPAYDFIEGQAYTAKVLEQESTTNSTSIIQEFTIERSVDMAAPEIVAIFPSGKLIPENTLRFYIHFSTPMKPQVSSDYIRLRDATGTEDTAAFMAFKQELWSEDRKRLTLLMDPGRIKRGVAQNITLGPALKEGQSYSIVIDEGWPTANGTDVMPRYEKSFTVSNPLRTLPDPALWKILSPAHLSHDPLLIEFDRPFDHALLHSSIWVTDDSGRAITGKISIENQERTWRFNRNGRWNNARIQIAIKNQLEDVAGNNFVELLDHSVAAESSKSNQTIITLDPIKSPN